MSRSLQEINYCYILLSMDPERSNPKGLISSGLCISKRNSCENIARLPSCIAATSYGMEYSKITIKDKAYPAQLKEITVPPPVLYYRSQLKNPFEVLNKKPMVGVVGSRRCTQYGKRATEHIVKSLVRAGIVIVSGMAEGIDTAAHKAALEAGGETIAVLGSGIDEKVIYPKSNIKLAREIEKHGMVMSEFDPYSHSEAFFFPQRNRVISGLSLGVLVVEAQKKSGSLITANFALQQDREVFAVPGGIFWGTSDGTNNLIKQGANPSQTRRIY